MCNSCNIYMEDKEMAVKSVSRKKKETLSEKILGKRLKDLTSDEKKVFYKIRARIKREDVSYRNMQKEVYNRYVAKDPEGFKAMRREYMRNYRKMLKVEGR